MWAWARARVEGLGLRVCLYENKKIIKVSVPTVGTGSYNKILKVGVLYKGFRVQRLGSI